MSSASSPKCLVILVFLHSCFMPHAAARADDWEDCRNWQIAHDQAIRSCTAVIRSGSEGRLAWAHLSRGIAYKRLGRNDLAIADYDHALALDPLMWEAFHARALHYAILGSNEAAISDWRKVLELNPDNPNAAKIRKILGELGSKRTVPPATTLTPSCAAGLVLANGQCVPAGTPHSPAVQPARPAEPSAQPVDLAVPLQLELQRISCYQGGIDGDWGRGSRSALARFLKQKGLRLGSEPSQAALDEARKTAAGYCKPVQAVRKRPNPKNKVAGRKMVRRTMSPMIAFRTFCLEDTNFCFKEAIPTMAGSD